MLEGWRHATVEEICQRVSVGIVIKPSQYYVENGEGIRAFRSANIGENKVVDRDWVYLSNAGHEAKQEICPPRRRRSGRAVRRPWHSMCRAKGFRRQQLHRCRVCASGSQSSSARVSG